MVFPQGLVFFAPNIGDFGGISQVTRRDNDAVLRLVTDYLKANPSASVRIEGHANPTTPPGTRERTAENPELLQLSEKRARTVMDALVSMGVDRSRLSVTGLGGSRIVVVFEDRENWYQNRRVEFIPGR
jgi:outer membrane protein OmpA-like peptidoglycan-associated protein